MQISYHTAGTKRTYAVGQRQWIQFCDELGITDRAYTEQNLIRFLTWLDMNVPEGIGGETAKNRVYAVKEYAVQQYGDIIQVKMEEAPRLARIRKILDYQKPATDGSDPIMIEDCIAMIKQIQNQNIPDWEKQTQQTMISYSFGEMKRAHECVSTRDTKRPLKHGELQLTIDPVTKQPYMRCVRITGKTHRKGTRSTPLQSAIVCKCKKWPKPLCALCNLIKLTKLKQENGISTDPSQPVFVRPLKTGRMTPYNEYKASALLKRLAKEAGLYEEDTTKDTKYSLHGFRKGGTMQAIHDNIPRAAILKQADWKTDKMIERYAKKTPINMHARNMINKYQ